MKPSFWESPTVLRVHAVIASVIVMTGIAVLLGSQLKMVSGVRMTLETSAPVDTEGWVRWKNSAKEQFGEPKSVRIRIPAGHGSVRAFLPMHARLFGLQIEAPGVGLGTVDLVGENVRLRADSPGDLVFDPVVSPARFPTWNPSRLK